MAYITDTSVEFHGNLKSSNILVNSRWSCLVADIGLSEIKEDNDNMEDEPNYNSKLYFMYIIVLQKKKVTLRQSSRSF